MPVVGRIKSSVGQCLTLALWLPLAQWGLSSGAFASGGNASTWEETFRACNPVQTPFFASRSRAGLEWEESKTGLIKSLDQFARTACGEQFLARPNDADAIRAFTASRDQVAKATLQFWNEGEQLSDFLDGSLGGMQWAVKALPGVRVSGELAGCAEHLRAQATKVHSTRAEVLESFRSAGRTCPRVSRALDEMVQAVKRAKAEPVQVGSSQPGRRPASRNESTITGKIREGRPR